MVSIGLGFDRKDQMWSTENRSPVPEDQKNVFSGFTDSEVEKIVFLARPEQFFGWNRFTNKGVGK